MTDPGIQTVEEIYEAFQIDGEWSERIDRGFTWWPASSRSAGWYLCS